MTFLARSWNHEFRVTSVYDKRYGVVEQDLFFGMSIARTEEGWMISSPPYEGRKVGLRVNDATKTLRS
ncbi:predicted protein [Histoplasma mississippiense (nom. inval.)]|uniref:predicted protein n=1 Tax=Ajellomyces capsulatus (strain NAm1 / WU24) TaxID=2059318 RepID=UPI000157C42E|nr:predicted protein [Histoplasma mississippiense (nom. inval.)]EDN07748.1 predicted protein [Histoplasma mississippiense (nom. inval.)]